jgi:hypothetical protein
MLQFILARTDPDRIAEHGCKQFQRAPIRWQIRRANRTPSFVMRQPENAPPGTMPAAGQYSNFGD